MWANRKYFRNIPKCYQLNMNVNTVNGIMYDIHMFIIRLSLVQETKIIDLWQKFFRQLLVQLPELLEFIWHVLLQYGTYLVPARIKYLAALILGFSISNNSRHLKGFEIEMPGKASPFRVCVVHNVNVLSMYFTTFSLSREVSDINSTSSGNPDTNSLETAIIESSSEMPSFANL